MAIMQWCRRRLLLMQRDSRRLTTVFSSSSTVDHDIVQSQQQVLVEGNGYSRLALLNRPSSLNAINTNMAARLHKLYRSWEDNHDIGFIMLKGSGRAFASGGDIVALYRFIKQGNTNACKEFFRTIYSFIYLIGTYLKPHVALLNGITMGGGAGISIPGTFRVATDKTVFATPEVLIGFHPDAAASFYLSRLPGHIGEYLALTGEKLNGVEMVACGLATHYSLLARLPLIEEQLRELVTDDPSVIETTLEQYGDLVHPGSNSVLQRLEVLDKCFGHDTVEEIVDALGSNQIVEIWEQHMRNACFLWLLLRDGKPKRMHPQPKAKPYPKLALTCLVYV